MNQTIEKYDFKEGLPYEFEILDLSFLYKEFESDITHPHRLEFYQIVWFQNGGFQHMVDFKTIEIKPNTLIFLNKNSVQQFSTNPNLEGKVLLFTDDFFCKTETNTQFLKSTILFNDLLSTSFINITQSIDLFTNIHKQIEAEQTNELDPVQLDILRNLLHNFLLLSERERRKQNFTEIKKDANLDYVFLFKKLLDQHFYKEKKVSFYCEQIHLTPKRLNHACKKVFDKTAKELIDERVMLEAKRLLAHTLDSIKEIGFQLGFEEPTNFNKYFKKHASKTPIQFREQFITA